jgi:hypothetical protein
MSDIDNASTTFPAAFMVMDESESSVAGIDGMIGLIVPLAVCTAVRHRWYGAIAALQKLPENHKSFPPVVHAVRMFHDEAWANDEDRVACFELAVKIVNEWRLRVYRCAYYTASLVELRRATHDQRSRGLFTFGLQCMAADVAANHYIIPLMDGLDKTIVRPLAGTSQGTVAFRAQGIAAENISIPFVDHYMDPVFADSRYSALIQIADCILYLLMVLDCKRTGGTLSPFKARLLPVAQRLDAELVREEIVLMQWG